MKNESILIVEDDSDIVALCKTIFEKNKYIVDEAAMGKNALNLISKKCYNLVILDLNLPDISGMDILKTIKTKYQNIDVIIITGDDSDKLRKEAIQLGAYDYIPKPFSPDEINLLVRHCLEKQKILDEANKFKQEVKNTQEKLIQSEKMAAMAKVIGYIVHELRKPLANIKTFSEYCLTSKTVSLDDKVRERLEIILRNVNKASKTIDDTLSFSRPVKVSLKAGSINEIIEKICKSFESEISSQLKIIKKLSDNFPSLKFDYGHIERAFSNIIQNSLQAMPQGGNLTIETMLNQKEKNIIINFIDTGCGISDEEIGQIFDPFFTKREGGIGLGLSFAKDIIELHGGRISVQSKEGEGTATTINLPIE